MIEPETEKGPTTLKSSIKVQSIKNYKAKKSIKKVIPIMSDEDLLEVARNYKN